MKRQLFTFIFALVAVIAFSQTVPRENVVIEIGTATW
jgi:hypothetical protein